MEADRRQSSETRKPIYQDRETDELRAQAASVRRQLRVGRGLTIARDLCKTLPGAKVAVIEHAGRLPQAGSAAGVRRAIAARDALSQPPA